MKIAVGRTEKKPAARGRLPKLVFKPLEEIADPKLVRAIARELIDDKPTRVRLYFYDSVSVVFFDKRNKAVMAVEYFVISKPSGGCSPRKIAFRDGLLCLESPKGNGVLISDSLERLIGWRFTPPVSL